MTRKLLLLASALSLFAVTPVWAGTITFNFADCGSIVSTLGTGGTCPGDLKTNEAVFTDTTTHTLEILAAGAYVSAQNTDPADLYVKHGGSSETGLGLANTVNHEINAGQGIALNLNDLSAHGIDSGTVWLGSLQQGEYGTVCALGIDSFSYASCHKVSETGTTAVGSLVVSWTASDPYLVFLGPGIVNSNSQWCGSTGGGNFLIDALTVQSSVPEPGSLALFGLGLAALGLAIASRKRALGR